MWWRFSWGWFKDFLDINNTKLRRTPRKRIWAVLTAGCFALCSGEECSWCGDLEEIQNHRLWGLSFYNLWFFIFRQLTHRHNCRSWWKRTSSHNPLQRRCKQWFNNRQRRLCMVDKGGGLKWLLWEMSLIKCCYHLFCLANKSCN